MAKHEIWSLLLATPLAVGCVATAQPRVPIAAPAPPPPEVHGFLAMCRVAHDLPSTVHEQLILVAEIQGREIREVPLDVELPDDLLWNVVTGGGTARTGEPDVIEDGQIRVVSVGACTEDGSIWATMPVVQTDRPELPGADAMEALVSERAAASEADRTEQRETSFEETAVHWLQAGDDEPFYLRVSHLDSGWSECEPPSEEGGDSTCGSSTETRFLVGRVAAGVEIESVEVLVESVGC